MFLGEYQAFPPARGPRPIQAATENHVHRVREGDGAATNGAVAVLAEHGATPELASKAQVQLVRSETLKGGCDRLSQVQVGPAVFKPFRLACVFHAFPLLLSPPPLLS